MSTWKPSSISCAYACVSTASCARCWRHHGSYLHCWFRASRSWRAWTSPRSACLRMAGSAYAWLAMKWTCGCRPCPPPTASGWCCVCWTSRQCVWTSTICRCPALCVLASCACWRNHMAFSWSPGPPVPARPRRCTPRFRTSTRYRAISSPSKTRSSTTFPASARPRSTPRST
ncbi:hypothetical protein D3C77_597440 [compost metagenome]